MTHREPDRRTTRRIPTILVAGLVVVAATIAASFGDPLRSAASMAHGSPQAPAAPPVATTELIRSEHRGAPGEADGVLANGVTVFDEGYPGIDGLDPDLLRALRRAATDAAHDGVELVVESGWRSPAYQERLLREAIATYGSPDAAARWGATPTTSPHVSGDAVDIGAADATDWLAEHGAEYGLCQIYRNEPWHYEWRPTAEDRGCPRMFADPTHDPRMQR